MRSIEPGISRFRVWSFGPSRNDGKNDNQQRKHHPMNNEIVLQKLDQGLLTITMNRPDRRNALNPDMTLGLVAAARRAAEDHEVRAVLLLSLIHISEPTR